MSKYVAIKGQEVGEASQYKLRVEYSEKEANSPYWNTLDLNLKNATIKAMRMVDVRPIIEKYEWLGKMAAVNKYAFGIFFKDTVTGVEVCGGVVTFGPEYSENLGVWDKYGYTSKLILLSRGVCLHWCPKNTNSKLVMGAINLLPKQYEIVTCTTDHTAGEIGTIYQACNFHYVGAMNDSNPNIKGKPRLRFAVLIDGKIYGSRSIRKIVGSQKKEDILKRFPNAEFIKQQTKHRYFYFTTNKKKHLKTIEHLVKPYPKRKIVK